MAQKTNLNAAPYYDDFDKDNNYVRTLFRPGFAVQARELTQLQSQLQYQIEAHGSHIFKEGALVVPGINNIKSYESLKLATQFGGENVDPSKYYNATTPVIITGATTGVQAEVIGFQAGSTTEQPLLFLNYTRAGTDNSTIRFSDTENITANVAIQHDTISYSADVASATTFTATSTVATSATGPAAVKGSAYFTKPGVYYVRGFFVAVTEQVIALDPYNRDFNGFVGFDITETLVTPEDESSLLDNAQGSSNFAAKGAHRLQFTLTLAKKTTSTNANFVQIAQIKNGVVVAQGRETEYSVLAEEFARRTFDESGNYTVRPFQFSVEESVTVNENTGRFALGATTDDGNTASSDLLAIKVSPGKAYVNGFEIDKNVPTFKDINKARDFENKNADITVFDTGNFALITNIYGTPDISEITSEATPFKEVQFYDTPTSSRGTANGTLIGVGRARSMQFSAGVAGSSSSNNTSVYRLYLFDLRPFTVLTLSDTPSPTLIANHADGVQVKGVTSGATGFVFGEGTSGTNVNLTNVVGTFVAGEKITASDSAETDDIVENSGNTDLTISKVVTNSFADFRQVFMNDPTNADEDFTADLVTEAETQVDFVLLEDSASRSEGSIVLEEDNSTVVSLERVESAKLKDAEKNIALFKPSHRVIKTHLTTANAGASDTQFTIRRQFIGTTNASGAVSFTAGTNETFVGFGEADYTLSVLDIGSGSGHADGDIVSVSGNISGTGTGTITITDSNFNSSKVKLLATTLKTSVTQKNKTVQLMKQVKVVHPSSGSHAYGTRPDDKEISLGRADAFKLVGVFDSEDTSTDATAPELTTGSITGTFTRGEKITGGTSGATGRIIDTTSPLSYVLTSTTDFAVGDVITGESSGATATVSAVTAGDTVITSDFLLDTGMRDNFYDISRLVRKPSVPAPQGRLLVVYDYMEHGTGDVMTVDSYTDVANQMDYEDIPTYSATKVDPDDPAPTGEFPLYETYDFRPRVANVAGASATLANVDEITGNSFDFTSRVFSGTGSSYSNFGKPASNIQSDLEYYLPKRASIFLDDRGNIIVREGASTELPQLPTPADNAMKLADLSLPAFTFKPQDVTLTRERTQRFTMRDIGNIEERLTNVERVTTLSLLEKDAQSFETTDANGLNRFKSGFIVDPFRGHSVGDVKNRDYKNSMDMQLGELRPIHKTKGIDLLEQATTDSARTTAGYQKTGDLLTLPYTEEVISEQPFATTVERVTPFLTASWAGKVVLDPDQDSWFETEIAPELVINREGNFDAVVAANRNQLGTVWNSWQDTWSGRVRTTRTQVSFNEGGGDDFFIQRIVETGTSRRTGTRTFVEESVERESQGFKVVSRVAIPVVRARNIRFDAEGLRPFTRVYVFFDKRDVNAFITPDADSTTDATPAAGSPLIVKSDSLCGGTFAIPDPKISGNPQFQTGDVQFKITGSSTNANNPTTFAQTTYSAKGILETRQETIIATRNGRLATENVNQSRGISRDIEFGADESGDGSEGGDSCFVAGTMVRMADGSDKKIEDVQVGDILLGMDESHNTVVQLDHWPLNGRNLVGINGSGPFKTPEHPLMTKDGWKAYNSQDTIEQKPQIAHLMTNGNLEVGDEIKDIDGNWILVESLEVFENEEEQQVYNFMLDGNNTYYADGLLAHNRDPLCQTFIIADEDKQFESDLGGSNSDAGRFITSIDLFFSAKDDTLPITVEIRNVVNGYPGPKVLPFSRVTLSPSQVNVSADGKTATKFTFKSPVYLQSMAEYCFVVLTNTPKYIMWICDLGQEDADGNLVSEQPHIGVLFKGHNNRTWVASPTQDAKFTMRAAKFDTTAAGAVTLTNDTLPSLTLGKNPLVMTNGNTALKVNHFDNQMHSTSNNVTISGVKSGAETTLNGAIGDAATSITLTSGTNFDDTSGKFSRNASNTYFIKIDDEIISYTAISGNNITGATRGVDGTTAASHANGATVELYMLHKVPFTEINKTHTAIANPATDYYTVSLSTTPVVASGGDSSFGGTAVIATENAMYDASSTVVGTLIPPECDIVSKIRPTTATSSSGSQTSFTLSTLGNAETVPLNDNYYYEDPFMIASEINETNEMSGSKSLIMPITLSSTNSNVSPVIDLKRMTFLAIANRINEIDSSSDVYPASIYDPMTDPEGDDHDAIYITKRALLENAATSLRVIFDANREDTADIKVLFRTLRTDDASDFDELDFKFFNDGGTVATSGGPDVAVSPSLGIDQFNEYEFTAGVTDDGIGTPLDEFIAFQIKIVMRATNSARPPRIKDLRILALAT